MRSLLPFLSHSAVTPPMATPASPDRILGNPYEGRNVFQMASAPALTPVVVSGRIFQTISPSEQEKYKAMILSEISLKCPLLAGDYRPFAKILVTEIYDAWKKSGFRADKGVISEDVIERTLREEGIGLIAKYKKTGLYKKYNAGIDDLSEQFRNPQSRSSYWGVPNPRDSIADRIVELYPSLKKSVRQNGLLQELTNAWINHNSPIRYEWKDGRIIASPECDEAIHNNISKMIATMEGSGTASDKLRPLYRARREHTRLHGRSIDQLVGYTLDQNLVLSGEEPVLGLPSARDLASRVNSARARSSTIENVLKTRSIEEFSDFVAEQGDHVLQDAVWQYIQHRSELLNPPQEPLVALKLLSLVLEREIEELGVQFFGESSFSRLWQLHEAVAKTVTGEQIADIIEGFSIVNGAAIAQAVRRYLSEENPDDTVLSAIPPECGIRARVMHFKDAGIKALRAELSRQQSATIQAQQEAAAARAKSADLSSRLSAARADLAANQELVEAALSVQTEDALKHDAEKLALLAARDRAIQEQATLHRDAVDALKEQQAQALAEIRGEVAAEKMIISAIAASLKSKDDPQAISDAIAKLWEASGRAEMYDAQLIELERLSDASGKGLAGVQQRIQELQRKSQELTALEGKLKLAESERDAAQKASDAAGEQLREVMRANSDLERAAAGLREQVDDYVKKSLEGNVTGAEIEALKGAQATNAKLLNDIGEELISNYSLDPKDVRNSAGMIDVHGIQKLVDQLKIKFDNFSGGSRPTLDDLDVREIARAEAAAGAARAQITDDSSHAIAAQAFAIGSRVAVEEPVADVEILDGAGLLIDEQGTPPPQPTANLGGDMGPVEEILNVDDVISTRWECSAEDSPYFFGQEQIPNLAPNHVVFNYDHEKKTWEFRRGGDSEEIYWKAVKLGPKKPQPLGTLDRILLGDVAIQVTISKNNGLILEIMDEKQGNDYLTQIRAATQRKTPPTPPPARPRRVSDHSFEPTPLPPAVPGLGSDTGPVAKIESAQPGQEWLDQWRTILFEKVANVAAAQKELARCSDEANQRPMELKARLQTHDGNLITEKREALKEAAEAVVAAFKSAFQKKANLTKYPQHPGDITPENSLAMSEIANLVFYQESFLAMLLGILDPNEQNPAHHPFVEPLSQLIGQLPGLLPSGQTTEQAAAGSTRAVFTPAYDNPSGTVPTPLRGLDGQGSRAPDTK